MLAFTPSATLQPGLLGRIMPNVPAAVVSTGIVAVLAIYGSRAHSRRTRVALMYVVAGGMSNLIDRIFRGAIVDIVTISGLTFNPADLLIMVGIILFLIPSQMRS